MSLLMDALKKAEMAKRQASAGAPEDAASAVHGPANNLALEPLAITRSEPAKSPPPPPVAEIAAHAGTGRTGKTAATEPDPAHAFGVSATLPPSHTAPRTPAPAPDKSHKASSAQPEARARQDAANVFAAKQTGAEPPAKRHFAIAVGATTGIAVIAIGVYFWLQLQPHSAMAPMAALSVPSGATAPAKAMPPPPAPVATQAPVAAPSAGAAPVTNKPADEERETEPLAPVAAAPAKRQSAPAPAETSPIRVTTNSLRVAPGLTNAHQALNQGDFQAAGRAYATVLAADPHNRDALLGMAMAAIRMNRSAEAETYYQRALAANPNDASALAGLAALQIRHNAPQAERRLAALAESQPEDAAAHVALGNLYASQSRWHEAQESFFAAYAIQPDNADLLYNLAISLEHLNQPKLAVQYYREALQAAKGRPTSFPVPQVEERLRQLSP